MKFLGSLVCVALWVSTSSATRADFIVSAESIDDGSSPRLLANDGTRKFFYTPTAFEGESYGSAYAVTPDRKIMYAFTNSLGVSLEVLAFDVVTGKQLTNLTLHAGTLPGPSAHGTFRAEQALIRTTDPFGKGDLFVSSEVSPTSRVIQRYNRATDSWVETISTGPGLIDFVFDNHNQIFVATAGGIGRGVETANGFKSWDAGLPGVTGWLALDSSDRLYVRNSVTGNIDRYSSSLQFLDTFIPASAIAGTTSTTFNRGSIQFGPDGDLYVHQVAPFGDPRFPVSGAYIGRYNGVTGQQVSLIHVYDFYRGRITVLPVSEPAAAFVAATALLALLPTVRRYR